MNSVLYIAMHDVTFSAPGFQILQFVIAVIDLYSFFKFIISKLFLIVNNPWNA